MLIVQPGTAGSFIMLHGTAGSFIMLHGTALNSLILLISSCPGGETSSYFPSLITTEVSPTYL